MKKFSKYWLLAINHTASKSINLFSEFQGDILRGFISLFALLGVSYLTSSGIIKALDYQAFLGDFESYARFFGMVFLLIPINFVLRLFIYTPAELFWEQKLIANKFNWEEVSFNVYQFPKDSIFGWGIKVHNQKNIELESVSARLIYLIQISNSLNEKKQIEISESGNFLSWDKGKGQSEWKEINIIKNSTKNLILINEDGYKMSWLFLTNALNSENTDNQLKLFDLYEYLFEIEFNGKIDGHDLEPYIFKGKLSKEKKGRKAIIEKI